MNVLDKITNNTNYTSKEESSLLLLRAAPSFT